LLNLHIDRWIHKVHISLVQLFPQPLQALAEALEVDDLPFPQEADNVVYVRVVAEAEDVVIGHPGLLFGGQVLRQVGDGVTLDGHGRGIPGEARGCRGVDTYGVVHEIGRERGVTELIVLQIPGQLVNDGPDHFQMAQFFGPQWSI